MQPVSSLIYPDILRWVSRGLLAALMHLGAMAGLSVPACAGFAAARGGDRCGVRQIRGSDADQLNKTLD
jgi:hypothetical protein